MSYSMIIPRVTGQVPIECPCCGGDLEVDVSAAEPPMQYPNGNHYPGYEGDIIPTGPCGCAEWIESHGDVDRYDEEVFNKVLEASP